MAGYAVEYDVSHLGKGSFEFKTVRGAGHMVPTDTPEPALELFRRFLEIPSANISYAEVVSSPVAVLSNCAPPAPAASAISPQVGLGLVMLVFVLFGSVVFLYQEVRSLRSRIYGGSGPDSQSGHSDRDGNSPIGMDNKIDVSERDATVHVDEEDSSQGGSIELMKGQVNSSGSRRL